MPDPTMQQLAFDLPTSGNRADPRYPRPLCFASGANEAGEIRGFVSIGIPVGVSAAHVGPDAVEELHRLAGHGIPVFADSGAYGEFSTHSRRRMPAGTAAARRAQLRVSKQISDAEWDRRLDLYADLASSFGTSLSAVAPDRVGDQELSHRRLARAANRVRAIAATGARILLPLHRGAQSLPEFFADARQILGVGLVPAFPMANGRYSVREILRTIDALEPPAVHLLGLGPRSTRAREILRLLALRAPDLRVSMDANFVSAAVGRRADGTAARPLTRAQDEIRARGFPDAHRAVANPGWGIHDDYTDSIARPSEWLGPAGLRAIAAACLDPPRAARWFRDPDGFLQEPINPGEPEGVTWWEHPVLSLALDVAWETFLHRRHVSPRKAEAISRIFVAHPAAGQFDVPAEFRITGASAAETLDAP